MQSQTPPSDLEAKAGCPVHGQAAEQPAFHVIDARPGFALLGRRPEAIYGSVLSRSTGCKPYMDGNKAGVHLTLGQPVMLSRDSERAAIQMTDELFAICNDGYEERLRNLVARGLLVDNGYWFQRLSQGAVQRNLGFISVWSGLLVKPAAGLWLLMTGSYNRRAGVNLRDTVFADDQGYTPLMLEFEAASMSKDTMWLESELACLVPIRPGVEWRRETIAGRRDLGDAYNEFYGGSYLETRGAGKAVGRYRKLVAGERPVANPGVARCSLVTIAGPDVHTIETFTNIAGSHGPMPEETGARLPYVMLRNFTPLEFDFDGLQSHLNNDDANTHGDELLEVWGDLFGKENAAHIDWWTSYFTGNVPMHYGEPNALIIPYAFVETPPGWSTLADGVHYPGLDSLRGIVATDVFYHAGPVLQFQRHGDFRLEAGDPLLRLLPVPPPLLGAPYELVDLE